MQRCSIHTLVRTLSTILKRALVIWKISPLDSDVIEYKMISSPRLRYLAVSVVNTTVSHSEGQVVCEQVGAGLATVLTDADYVALNTTVHQSGAPYNCNVRRMHMGAKSYGNFTWEWRTGDPLSINWTYWEPGEPDGPRIVCMRARAKPGVPVSFFDLGCDDTNVNCVLCDV